MDKLNIPYLAPAAIRRRADELRSLYLGGDYTLPIDVEQLATDMGLDFWPVEGLMSKTNIDALVAHSLKTIIVDAGEYNDPVRWGRLRFTIAHEIGHYVLHAHLFAKAKFTTIDSWIQFLQSFRNYDRVEVQAHEFGGRLVVPMERLKLAIQQHKQELPDVSGEELVERLSVRISKDFWVSPDLIRVRFDREDLMSHIRAG